MAEQPKAASVSLEDFIEIATQAALRAVEAHSAQAALNPQPLPPGGKEAALRRPGGGPIVIGIVVAPERLPQ